MQVLDRLALTLGVPVESFFEDHARSASADEATAEEIGQLTDAFAAIIDPVMRRYCLDVVKAAGNDGRSDATT